MTLLPPELLLLILEDFIPRPNGLGVWALPENDFNPESYYKQTKFLASLSLVSSQWYQVVAPSLYSTLLISIDHNGWCLRGLAALEMYPRFIRHLILKCPDAHDYMTRSTNSRFKDAALLEKSLKKCVNLNTLHLIDPEDLFFRMSASTCLRLFQACRPSMSNLKSVVVGRQGGDYPIYPLSKILLGLGPDGCKGLSNLEVSCWKTYSDRERSSRYCSLPTCLSNITRLVLNYGWTFPLAYFNLLSRIYREVPDSQVGRSRKQKTTPLRELVIHSSFCEPKLHWATQIFSINNFGASLSVLEVQSSPYPFTHDKYVTRDDYDYAPLEILRLCPQLTVFKYFVPCPVTIFSHLPSTLRELGVRVTLCRDPVYLTYLPLTTITSFESIAEFVRSNDLRRSVDSIVVDVRRHHLFTGATLSNIPELSMDSWTGLEKDCSSKGISLDILST